MAQPHKKVPVQTAVDLRLFHYIATGAISALFAPYNFFVVLRGTGISQVGSGPRAMELRGGWGLSVFEFHFLLTTTNEAKKKTHTNHRPPRTYYSSTSYRNSILYRDFSYTSLTQN